MTYSEAQNLHNISSIRHDLVRSGRGDVLRAVLAIVVDRETAARCLHHDKPAPVTRWPSTMYSVLGRAALRSPLVWRRCALVLDRALHDAVAVYAERPAADLVEVFLDGRESMTGDELAAVLWVLIRRRCPMHDLIAERLSRELEVVAARRLHT